MILSLRMEIRTKRTQAFFPHLSSTDPFTIHERSLRYTRTHEHTNTRVKYFVCLLKLVTSEQWEFGGKEWSDKTGNLEKLMEIILEIFKTNL